MKNLNCHTFINTGMYLLNSQLIKEIPENKFFHMTDLIDRLMKEGRTVGNVSN